MHQHGPPGTVVCGQGDSGAPAWASRDRGVRTYRGTVVHQHGPPGTVVWTVVHQHGPPGTVVCGQGDSGAAVEMIATA